DPFFDAWQRSLPFDCILLGEEIEASKAHALALRAAGILTEDECARIAGALVAVGEKYGKEAGHDAIRADAQAEDIHHFVERRLVESIGDLGLKLHTGRSRNEQIATDLRLYIRTSIRGVLSANLVAWAQQLVEQALAAGDAVMPA